MVGLLVLRQIIQIDVMFMSAFLFKQIYDSNQLFLLNNNRLFTQLNGFKYFK